MKVDLKLHPQVIRKINYFENKIQKLNITKQKRSRNYGLSLKDSKGNTSITELQSLQHLTILLIPCALHEWAV